MEQGRSRSYQMVAHMSMGRYSEYVRIDKERGLGVILRA